MEITRRRLMAAAAFGAVAGPALTTLAAPVKPLKILVLGGTGFIGPHVVRRALKRGHEVTLFNRGRSNSHLFPEVNRLVGDRDGGLQALETGSWDAVLDNSGYVPRHVNDSAQLLKDRVGRYLFTSTISVYDFADPSYPTGVGSALELLSEPGSEEVGKHYGALKVLCEQAINDTYGDRATIVRPTYVVGPGDHTQRFTWWVVRTAEGGDMIAPGDPLGPATLIDVRDLAHFMIHLLEQDTPGVFNAAGPASPLTFGEMLAGIRATTSTPANHLWMPAEFLAEEEVTGNQLPMWSPEFSRLRGNLVANANSMAAGLAFTPLADTARDTLEWHRSLPSEQQAFTRTGLSAEQEAKVIADWRSANS